MATWKKNSRNNSQKAGRKSSKRARTEKKRKTRKWHQKGCQSGGGSAWSASNIQHQVAGGAGAGATLGGNGAGLGALAGPSTGSPNHFAFNTSVSSIPQNTNHLAEKGFLGGSRRRRRGHPRHRHRRSSKHRRYIGEQRGGYAEYLPEVANAGVRGVVEVPSNMMNSIQGAATAFKTSNPTVQPIGAPIQLV